MSRPSTRFVATADHDGNDVDDDDLSSEVTEPLMLTRYRSRSLSPSHRSSYTQSSSLQDIGENASSSGVDARHWTTLSTTWSDATASSSYVRAPSSSISTPIKPRSSVCRHGQWKTSGLERIVCTCNCVYCTTEPTNPKHIKLAIVHSSTPQYNGKKYDRIGLFRF